MHSLITVDEELDYLHATLQGAFVALVGQNPALEETLVAHNAALTSVRDGHGSAQQMLEALHAFLATLDEGKLAESETYHNALAHALGKVRETLRRLSTASAA